MMRSSARTFLSVLSLMASAFFMGAAPAMAKANAGTLTCTVSPSQLQSDIAAKANLSCRFDPIAGPKAKLTGTVKRLGVREERNTKLGLVWSVVAPKTDVSIDDLAGKYKGAVQGSPSTSAWAARGGLLGGRNEEIKLRPLTSDPNVPDGWGVSILELELSAVKA